MFFLPWFYPIRDRAGASHEGTQLIDAPTDSESTSRPLEGGRWTTSFNKPQLLVHPRATLCIALVCLLHRKSASRFNRTMSCEFPSLQSAISKLETRSSM